MISKKLPKCGFCKKEFKPFKPLQMTCSAQCFYDLGMKKKAEIDEKKNKEWKTKAKEKEAKISYFEALLQVEINAIIRLIDKDLPNCISCDPKTPIKQAFAGHFHAIGGHNHLRFNLHNEHRQCFSCNGKKGGRPIQYIDGLVREYGEEYADYVQFTMRRNFPIMKWTKEDVKGWIEIARLIKKELIELDNTYTAEERIELRKELNFRIGIYK